MIGEICSDRGARKTEMRFCECNRWTARKRVPVGNNSGKRRPFEQVNSGFELTVNPNQVVTDIACSHHLTTYLWLMGQQANVNAGIPNPECVAN
jgi:hypothetical protein